MHKVQKCKRCEALDLNEKGRASWQCRGAVDEKNPHIRNNRDGTVIKLDVNSGVCTVDMWVCLDETGPVSAAKDSEWLECRTQICKTKDEAKQ